MFCYQCEQTAGGKACTKGGVCGKTPETSDIQDALNHMAKGVAVYASALAEKGIDDLEAGRFVIEALFTTITNVNFSASDVEKWVRRGEVLRKRLAEKYTALYPSAPALPDAATFVPAATLDGLSKQAKLFGVEALRERLGETAAGLVEMTFYGLKGAAAYADHARHLGQEDVALYRAFHNCLAKVAQEKGDLPALALEAGAVNLKAMELLDKANTGAYGHPVPTKVRMTPVAGKAILISGHEDPSSHGRK